LPGLLSPEQVALLLSRRQAEQTARHRRAPGVATHPAVPASPPVPAQVTMGVITVVLNKANGAYINAVSQSAATPSGNPGCPVTMNYTFGSKVTGSSQSVTLALPWGTWKLYQGGSSTATTNQIGNSGMTPSTGTTIVKESSNAVTFDPRVAS